jgi:hypothetical protein
VAIKVVLYNRIEERTKNPKLFQNTFCAIRLLDFILQHLPLSDGLFKGSCSSETSFVTDGIVGIRLTELFSRGPSNRTQERTAGRDPIKMRPISWRLTRVDRSGRQLSLAQNPTTPNTASLWNVSHADRPIVKPTPPNILDTGDVPQWSLHARGHLEPRHTAP